MVEAARFIVLTLGTFAGPSRFLDSHPAKHDADQDHRYAEAHAGAEELVVALILALLLPIIARNKRVLIIQPL